MGLTLSRKPSEEIIITDGETVIRVMVVTVSNYKTRLDVTAPKNWRVDRLEIHKLRKDDD